MDAHDGTLSSSVTAIFVERPDTRANGIFAIAFRQNARLLLLARKPLMFQAAEFANFSRHHFADHLTYKVTKVVSPSAATDV